MAQGNGLSQSVLLHRNFNSVIVYLHVMFSETVTLQVSARQVRKGKTTVFANLKTLLSDVKEMSNIGLSTMEEALPVARKYAHSIFSMGKKCTPLYEGRHILTSMTDASVAQPPLH